MPRRPLLKRVERRTLRKDFVKRRVRIAHLCQEITIRTGANVYVCIVTPDCMAKQAVVIGNGYNLKRVIEDVPSDQIYQYEEIDHTLARKVDELQLDRCQPGAKPSKSSFVDESRSSSSMGFKNDIKERSLLLQHHDDEGLEKEEKQQHRRRPSSYCSSFYLYKRRVLDNALSKSAT